MWFSKPCVICSTHICSCKIDILPCNLSRHYKSSSVCLSHTKLQVNSSDGCLDRVYDDALEDAKFFKFLSTHSSFSIVIDVILAECYNRDVTLIVVCFDVNVFFSVTTHTKRRSL